MRKNDFSLPIVLGLSLLILLTLSFGETGQSPGHTRGVVSLESTDCSCGEPPLDSGVIHMGIILMGQMYQNQEYDDNTMLSVIEAYWDGSKWDMNEKWGSRPLDGYVVYAVGRVALLFKCELDNFPNTKEKMKSMFRDYVSRDLNNSNEEWFYEGIGNWNSWSEDFMGFALGFAAADVWLDEPGEDYEFKVRDAVTRAFSINDTPGSTGHPPRTLESNFDYAENSCHVMLRNHLQYNPVYAMLIIKHIWDINLIYKHYDNRTFYHSGNKPPNMDELYQWVVSKIKRDPGGEHEFEKDTCLTSAGSYGPCDDRGVHKREPGHYPLGAFLREFGIRNDLDLFGPPCNCTGPAGITQRAHNYHYNCIFTDLDKDCINYDYQPVLKIHYYGKNGPTEYEVKNECLDHRIEFVFDRNLGRFEERPEGGCFPPHLRKDNPTFVGLQMLPKGHFFVYGRVRDTWGGWLILPQSILDGINRGKVSVTNTDPYQSENCYWNNEPRYLNIGDEGYFEVYLRDNKGKEFYRHIKMKLVGKKMN